MTIDDLRRLQDISYSTLKTIVNICDKHGIVYYLDHGTLLGAVRHKGWIPWDQDIDIMMDRDNLRRFLMVKSELPDYLYIPESMFNGGPEDSFYTGELRVFNKKAESNYIDNNIWYNICIDIFVLDYARNNMNSLTSRIVRIICKALNSALIPIDEYNRLKRHWGGYSLKTFAIRGTRLLKVLFGEIKLKKLNRIIQISSKDTGKVLCLIYPQLVYPISWFGEGEYQQFEGDDFRSPNNWKSLLNIWYGDYMQFPNEKDRYSFLNKWKIRFSNIAE